jgi:hypothetical protein
MRKHVVLVIEGELIADSAGATSSFAVGKRVFARIRQRLRRDGRRHQNIKSVKLEASIGGAVHLLGELQMCRHSESFASD